MKERKVCLRLIETSDVHGCFFPYDFIERRQARGSLARVYSYVKELRERYGDRLILLENGDILQGQPTCYYSNFIDNSGMNTAAEVTNFMGYDVQTMGNHDIETGHRVYDKWIEETHCPVIGANIIDKKTGEPYLTPYVIINRDGVSIAILGLITPAIPYWLNESLWSGLRFEDMIASAEKWVKHIRERERPDIIVGMFHSGWNGGIGTIHYNEDETEEIARRVAGFDVIFFGHDHTMRIETIENAEGGEVVCIDPSCNAIAVGDVAIELTIREGKVVAKNIKGQITDIRNRPIDYEFIEHFRDTISTVSNYVERRIGSFATPIRSLESFFGNAPFSDFVHNIQLRITDADISFNAPLSFNSTIEAGDVYMSDMFKLYRYENQVYVLKMTGEEIRKHLEMSYDQWVNTMKNADDHIMLLKETIKDGKRQYRFKNLTFNFESAAGIDYTVDVTKPDGQKVRISGMSNGQPFDEKKWYKVVMNSYRGNGGGELLTKGAGIPKEELASRIIYQSELDQRYYITKEIETAGMVYPKANDNWRFVPEEWTAPALERDFLLISD